MVVPTRTKINLGFGLTLAFLAVISVFTYRESLLSIQAVRWVDHTHETLEQLATTLSLVVEAEAARRGYVVTGDPSYLDRYDTIPARLESSLQRLRELTSDKPNDEGRLHQLEPLVRKKLQSLHTSIQLRKEQGTATTEQETLTEQGKSLADQIRRLTEEMQEEQRTLLIERTAKSQESAWTMVKIAAEVVVALRGAESLRQGLQQCAEILVRDVNAASARIWMVNQEDKVLELQASAGMYTHLDGGHARVPLGQFKIGHIAENGEPHLTNTVQQDSWVGDPEWARRTI